MRVWLKRVKWTLAPAVAALCLAAPAVAVPVSAVEVHEEHLDPAVTVWCLGEPGKVKIAAQGFGIDVGTKSDPEKFVRHKRQVSVLEWAESIKGVDASEFEKACRTAFVAAHAGAEIALGGQKGDDQEQKGGGEGSDDEDDDSDSNGVSSDALVGVGGVLLGGVITGAGGALAGRRRSLHDDADEIRLLDAKFKSDVATYAEQPNAETAQQAQVSGIMLRDAVGEWKKRVDSEKVETAEGAIREVLEGDVPYIGDLGDLSRTEEREHNVKQLLLKAQRAHLSVAGVADQIARFFRSGGREAQPPEGEPAQTP
jgi:hypothetical protein